MREPTPSSLPTMPSCASAVDAQLDHLALDVLLDQRAR